MPDSYTTRRDATFGDAAIQFTTNTGIPLRLNITEPYGTDKHHVITERADGRETTLWYEAANGDAVQARIDLERDHVVTSRHHIDARHLINELRRGVPETVLLARLGL